MHTLYPSIPAIPPALAFTRHQLRLTAPFSLFCTGPRAKSSVNVPHADQLQNLASKKYGLMHQFKINSSLKWNDSLRYSSKVGSFLFWAAVLLWKKWTLTHHFLSQSASTQSNRGLNGRLSVWGVYFCVFGQVCGVLRVGCVWNKMEKVIRKVQIITKIKNWIIRRL